MKGRALFMPVTSREAYKVNIKLKREYAPYEVCKEETNILKKNLKPMNYYYHYDKKMEIKEEELDREMNKLEEAWKIKKRTAWMLIENYLRIG